MTHPTPSSMPMRRTPPKATTAPLGSNSTPPDPSGWRDDISLPPATLHLFLDTGIWYSIANSLQHAGTHLAAVVKGHETNQTIANEVAKEPVGRSGAVPGYQMIVELVGRDSRDPCPPAASPNTVQLIQKQLIADSQRRTRVAATSPAARRAHAGEAELIACARTHQPAALVATNDAGASAVAFRHNVDSVHFGHVVRAAVTEGALSVDDALLAYSAGLAVSGLPTWERTRTETAAWLST